MKERPSARRHGVSRAPLDARFAAPPELDLAASHQMQISGPGDPSARVTRDHVVRCLRGPGGPATLEWVQRDGVVACRVWGADAEWALERAPEWCGLQDRPPIAEELPPPFRALARVGRGLRLLRTPRILDLLVLIVLEQLVAGKEARRAHHALLRRFSSPAPGPFPDLVLPLAPATLAELAPAALVRFGVAPRRTELLRELGFRATRLEALAQRPPDAVEAGLCSLRGIGVWTARSLLLRGLADADAVPTGDYHLPHLVAYHLGTPGEAAGDPDDARMLELLAPAAGQRGRVVMWLHRAGMPPRRAPRARLRALSAYDPPRGWFDS